MAEEESFWWRRGIFQKPRAVVRWDHTEEGRMSRSVAEEGRKVTWSELFFDLVFVTLISRLGEAFQEGHMTLLQAVLVFRVLIENWWDVTMYTCRFFTDDVPSKLINGAHMFLLIMAGMKLQEPFEDSVPTFLYYSGVLHLFIMLPYIRVVFWIKEYRAFTTATGLLPALVKGVFLISLSHADPRWFVPGMALQIVSTVLHHYVTFNCSCIKFNKASRLPIHLEHMIERRGCLRLIVLGEVVTGVTVDPKNIDAMAISFILLGYLLVFNMKLLAFDVDVVHIDRHAWRRGGVYAVTITEADHLFDASIAALGSCVKIVLTVLLHADKDREGAGEERANGSNYIFQSEAHLLLCGAVVVGLVALLLQRLCHVQDFELQDMDANDVVNEPEGVELLDSEASQAGYGSINEGHQLRRQETYKEARYNVQLAKAIYYVQMVMHVCTILMVAGLAVYCMSIQAEYEFLLVLVALWVLTSILITVNLLDEALLF
mmetsp:Transcript_18750/g.70959  ORF Transcript_18750/g.70959 Transcript_18750/m.70959 type:complete len:488 (-) Transcript_18750:221-1684(-)